MTDRPTILVVDDEEGPRESLRMILKPKYNILMAKDAITAMDIVKKERIDIITVDLKMQDIGGIELVKSIKSFNSDMEVIIITGYGNYKTAREAIKFNVFDYIEKPFDINYLTRIIQKSIEKRRLDSQQKNLIKDLEKLLAYKDPKGGSKNIDTSQLTAKVKETLGKSSLLNSQSFSQHYIEFINVLSNTLESQDIYTHGHSERVNYISHNIATSLGMSSEAKEELQIGSFLHDIGKIGVNSNYISKEGTLTKRERLKIKEHTQKGVEVVSPLNLNKDIASIIKNHHERYDGKGYPDRLKGDQIPLFARIVMIADTFDAMMSDRPYRKAIRLSEVKEELKTCKNTQFDAEIVDIFLASIKDGHLVRSCYKYLH